MPIKLVGYFLFKVNNASLYQQYSKNVTLTYIRLILIKFMIILNLPFITHPCSLFQDNEHFFSFLYVNRLQRT